MVGGKNSKRGWWPWQIGLYKHNYGGKLKSDVVVFVYWEYLLRIMDTFLLSSCLLKDYSLFVVVL